MCPRTSRWWYALWSRPRDCSSSGTSAPSTPSSSSRRKARSGNGSARSARARRRAARRARPRSAAASRRATATVAGSTEKPICSAMRASRSRRTGSSESACRPTSRRRRASRSASPPCRSTTGAPGDDRQRQRVDREVAPGEVLREVRALERRDVDLEGQAAALHPPRAEGAREPEAVRPAVGAAERAAAAAGVARDGHVEVGARGPPEQGVAHARPHHPGLALDRGEGRQQGVQPGRPHPSCTRGIRGADGAGHLVVDRLAPARRPPRRVTRSSP